MNYYWLLPLLGFTASLSLGFFTIGVDPRSRLNRLFFLTTLALATWCAVDFLMNSAPHVEPALFWSRFSHWGPAFTAVLAVHFFSVYTGVALIGIKRSLLRLLYALALILALVDQTTDLINTVPVHKYWGYVAGPGSLYFLAVLFIAGCVGGGLLLAVRFYLKSESAGQRKQARLLIVAVMIPLLGGIVTEILFVAWELDFVPLTTTLTTVMMFFIGYAMWRYRLMIPLEYQLRAVEEKFEKLFNTIPDAIALLSAEGRIIEVNRAMAGLLSLTRQEAIGRNVPSLLPETAVPKIMRTAGEAVASGDLREAEIRIEDRSYHHLFIPARSLSEEAILWILQDITDRKRAEASLRTQEKSLADIIEGSPIPTYILDRDHRVIHWNHSLARLSGIGAADMIGTRDHRRVFYHEDRPVIADLILDGRTDQLDIYYPDKYTPSILAGAFEAQDFFPHLGGGGRWLYFTASPLFDGEGRIMAAMTTLQDVTDREKAEAELRSSEEKFRVLAENANDIIWTADENMVLTYISPSVRRLTGFEPEVTLNQPVDKHLPPGSRELVRQIVQTYRDREASGDAVVQLPIVELEHYCTDGSTIQVEVSLAVLRDSAGVATGLMGVSRDITDRKKYEQKLQEAKQQAEAANAAKSQFLANMSHEIRTPMNGVLGMVELLSSTALNAEQREYADIIYSSANSLLEIINDILDVSRIEAGRMEIVAEPFNLSETVNGVKNILRYAAENKGLDLRVEYDAPTMVIGDKTRVRQVLLNLAGNAIKFTREGEVAIRVRHDPDRSFFLLAVSDTGIGIPRELQASIFELFKQVDDGDTREYEGTGLGLTISKSLVELMGGRITVDSEVGRGTTFTVNLPLIPVASSGDADETEEVRCPLPADGSDAVLVVEDNPASRLLMKHLLGKVGWIVDTAADGAEALEKMKECRYRAVFLDIRMPQLDGLSLTRQIRNRDVVVLDHDIYIIAMTADALDEDRERCLAAGMNDYLVKPVSADTVNRALSRAFRSL